jgi:amino acid adenylation domain-containing protein
MTDLPPEQDPTRPGSAVDLPGRHAAAEVESVPAADGRAARALRLRESVARALDGNLPPGGVLDPRLPLACFGLDSLGAAELQHALEEWPGIELPASELLQTSLAELEAAVDSAGGEGRTTLPPIRRRGAGASPPPASFAQERLWFLSRLEPESPLYNLQLAVSLAGPLAAGALEAALREIVHRHEALRTRFAEVAGRLVQVIEPPPERVPGPALPPPAGSGHRGGRGGPGPALPRLARLPLVDLATLPATAAAGVEAARIAGDDARRPFRLDRGPLVRMRLLRLGPRRHTLLLGLHHIVADGWSVGLLLREAGTLYGAAAARRSSPLPPPPLQVADFAAWQREWLQGAALAARLAHFQESLRGVPPLALPADRRGPLRLDHRGGRRAIAVPAPLAGSLRALGRRAGATPFMALLAVFQAVLARHAGQLDFAVGVPVAGRPTSQAAEVVGLFANTVALRAGLAGDPTFDQLLARVRAAALGAFAHQDLPFEKLVEALAPERDAESQPLCQVMFALADFPAAPPRMPGLDAGVAEIDSGTAKFDLTLELAPRGEGFAGVLEYRSSLFDPATASRLADQLANAVAAAVPAPGARCSLLPLLGPGERQQLLHEWSGGGPAAAPGTVHAAFLAAAARAPGTPAIRWRGEELSFGELARRSALLAQRLAGLGVGPETVVGVLLSGSPDLAVALLAVLRAGGAYLPLDPDQPPARSAAMLADAAAPLLLARGAPPALPGWNGTVLDAAAVEAEAGDGPPCLLPEPAVDPDGAAYVVFTSGSTGRPKGVVVPHRALLNLCRAVAERYRLGPGDRVLQFASPGFDVAAEELFASWLAGATVVPRPEGPASIADLARHLAAEELTAANLPASFWHAWTAELGDAPPPASLRRIVVGSEPVATARLAAWRGQLGERVRIDNAYGVAEAAVTTTVHDAFAPAPGGQASGPIVPIGRPLAGTEVLLLDLALEPVPIGAAGELAIGGEGLARCYLQRADLTAERFVPHPFAAAAGARLFRTGDLARHLPDGTLEILGRRDRQVKVRGVRVEPGEVEAALVEHPGVAHAAAGMWPAARSVPAAPGSLSAADAAPSPPARLVAWIVPRGPAAPAAEELRRFLAARLPAAMLPAAFVPLAALPLTPSGKPDRTALPDPEPPVPLAGTGPAAPRTPAEAALARVWADVLGLSRVGVDESFFVLGGDSISSLQVVSGARAAGLHVTVRQLFQNPTIAALAAVSEAVAANAADAAGAAVQTAGPPPSPPVVPAAGGGRTPADFPLARLGQDALDRLLGGDTDVEDLYPLTPVQQGMLFHTRRAPRSGAYVEQLGWIFVGAFDAAAWQRAWLWVTARHPVLRTAFVDHLEEPLQLVRKRADPEWHREDWSGLAPDRQAEMLARHLARDRARGFEVGRAPLQRFALVELGDGRRQFVWSQHHLLLDGWSAGAVLAEVLAAYLALAAGHEPALPPARPFRDYVAWLATRNRAADLEFWRTRLAGFSAPSSLGLDRPADRGGDLAEDGALERDAWDCRGRLLAAAISAGLRATARRRGWTAGTLVQAAWALLLARYGAASDVVFGTVVSGRAGTLEGAAAIVGLLINTLPVRAELAAAARRRAAGAWLDAFQARLFELLRHEATPLAEIQGASGVPRRLPLFESVVAFENVPLDRTLREWQAGARVEGLFSVARTHYPLTLIAALDDRLGLELVFARRRFAAAAVERLTGHLANLLAALAADPDQPLGELPMLDAAERHQLQQEANDAAAAYPAAARVHELVAAQAARTPDAVAVHAGGEAVSYGQLAALSGRLARRLARLGVGPEVVVGLCAGRSPRLVAALLAVLEAGGAYLPLDPGHPRERLAAILADASASLVLGEPQLLADLPPGQAPIVALDLAALDGETAADDRRSPPRCDPENLAYVIYTSGSTGRPKGVEVRHRALVNYLAAMAARPGLGPGDVMLAATTLSFDIAVTELLLPLTVGARVELIGRETAGDASLLAAAIDAAGATCMQATPATWALLLQGGWPGRPGLRALCGGEALPGALADELRPRVAELWNLYGPTETTVWSALARLPAHRAAGRSTPPLGRPLANTALRLLDRHDDGTDPGPLGPPVPLGVAGELAIGGEGLARGYRGRPDLTAERFVPDPWGPPGSRLYRTGDLARRREDGELEFLGRGDLQVKIRGFRIELGEIEAVLGRHPLVAAAAVAAIAAPADRRQDAPAASRLVAYVVPVAELRQAPTRCLVELESEHLAGWREVYDRLYEPAAGARTAAAAAPARAGAPPPADAEFDLAGWRSSFTGEPFPAAQMREQVEQTAARVLAAAPRRVLEIGCGTGLLLFRVAPRCEGYHATDFSRAAIDRLARRLRQRELPQASLEARPAHDFSGLAAGSFDTVVLNSVVQYFPSADYLVEVLEQACALAAPGGSVFVGDVRSLPLLRALHAALELEPAPPALTAAELSRRVRERGQAESELALDPRFFAALREHLPRRASVVIEPRRGRCHDELTRFRYDVLLRLDPAPGPPVEIPWQPWTERRLSLPALRRLLAVEGPAVLALSEVANARLAGEIRTVEWLDRGGGGGRRVRDLREMRERPGGETAGLDPEDLWRLAGELPYRVDVRWAAHGPEGRFDVVFRRRGGPWDGLPEPAELRRGAAAEPRGASALANQPLAARSGRALAAVLRGFLQRQLPDYMVPGAIVVLDELPLSPNGKLDRRALPDPDLSARHRPESFMAPRTAIEETVAAAWRDLLGIGRVGVEDDFFALGGHSLLAGRLAARLRAAFGIALDLSTLLDRPTLGAMAAAVTAALAGPGPEEAGLGAARRDGEIPRRHAGAPPAPLSFGQQRLWLAQQMSPASPAYNMPVVVDLAGKLDRRALAAALSEVVRRHEVLRSAIEARGGDVVQVVAPAAALPLPHLDLSGLPAAAAAAEAERRAGDEARRPFDLGRAPLLRATLLEIGPHEHRLVAVLHHVAADGWSTAILMREAGELYTAAAAGRRPLLAELPIQVADWAAWQRERLSGELFTTELDGWRERLAGMPPLVLPVDRQRPPVESFRGLRRSRLLPPPLGAALARLSRRHGATRFMTLAAGFMALLGRWTGQDDFGIGTPAAGRTRVETEGLIGCFVNLLALRADLAGDPSFAQLLARVRETVAAAHAHQELPFESLVEHLAQPRDHSRHPLVQAVLAVQEAPREPPALPGLSLRLRELDTGTAKLDLTLEIVEQPGGGLLAGLEMASDLFDGATALRLLGQFESLLGAAGEAPATPLGDLPLLGPAEIHHLLREWNDSRSIYPREAGVDELFAEWARAAPDAPAVVTSGRPAAGSAAAAAADGNAEEIWSYGRLAAEASRLAARLRSLGVGLESRVAVSMERSPELIAALLAILMSGAAYVPLDPSYPDERLHFMLEDAEARLLLVHGRTRRRLAGLARPDGAPAMRLLCVDAEREASASPGEASTGTGEASPGRGEASASPGDASDGSRRGEPPPPRQPGLAERLAYVSYTSGSTGRPKGVAVPHRAIARLVRGTNHARLGPLDCVAHLASISFDAATFEIWGALANGAAVAVVEREAVLDPAKLAARLRAAGVTAAFLTSALFEQVVTREPAAFRPLRHLLVGGAALDPAAAERALAGGAPGRLLNAYGPTESTTFAAWSEVRRIAPGQLSVPVGRPLANTTAYVVGPRGELATPGQVGELWLGGEGLARGYLRRPELTAAAFVPDPWGGQAGGRLYRTGDLARRLADGAIDLLGRIDDQVKIRGFRVEPRETEAVLARCPGVLQCAVTVARDEPGRPRQARLVAYVVAAPEAGLREETVREHLKRSLPEPMLPAACRFLPSLPLTPNGKLDRAALAEPRGEERRDAAWLVPRDPVEELLAGVWEEVLGIDRVGVLDDFFTLGGHSLLAAQVVSRVRQALGVELGLRGLFEAPTVAGLAAAIGGSRAAAGEAPAPIPRRELGGEPTGSGADRSLPLSFGQQRLWFIHQLDRESPAYNLPVALRLDGALAAGALAGALAGVVRRHEVLRTAIVDAGGGQAAQEVMAADLALPTIDLSRLPGPVREEAAARLAAAAARRTFDLARPPLARAILLRLAGGRQGRHLLAVNLHHVAADGWSIAILVRETAAAYQALAARRASLPAAIAAGAAAVPAPPLQYADWAVWQRRRLQGDLLAGELAFWRRRLAGMPDLQLPADRPRPPALGWRGLHRSLLLPPGTAEGLARLARRRGATLFMIMAAAFAALLRRWTGDEDFGIGTPVAGRTRVETEGLIGFFVNTLVLRVDLPGDPPFAALLAHLRHELLEAHAHQELPFERLVEELAPRRDLSRQPLVQAVVVLQNVPRQSLALPGLTITEVPVETGTAKTDLTLEIEREGEGLRAGFEVSRDLFDGATATRLLDQLQRLLAAAVEDPEQPLSRLALLGAAERQQLLVEWAGGACRHAAEIPLHRLFEAQARRAPAAVALCCAGELLSYGELDRRADRLARRLRDLGVGPEIRVGICLERSAELVVAVVAVLKAGGAYLPLDPDYPRERLAWLLRDAAAPVVVTRSQLAGRLPAAAAHPLLEPEPPRLVFLHAAGAAPGDAGAAAAKCLPDHPAYVIHTSGSTGRPKGVVVTHRNAARLFTATRSWFDFGPGDVWTLFHSYAFDFSVWEIWGALLHGGRLVVVPWWVSRSPEDLLELLRDEQVTALSQTPSAFALLQQAEERLGTPAELPSLRVVMFGGEALEPRQLRPWFDRHGDRRPRLFNLYGITETTVHVTCRPLAAADAASGVSAVGRPIEDLRLRVLDRRLQPAPIGVPGEICVGGPGLARGYLGRPELTAERFIPDPLAGVPGEGGFPANGGAPENLAAAGARLYRSGDLARWRPNGDLEVLGRIDSQVKVRGFRIELGEIEATLREHPGVRECAVAPIAAIAAVSGVDEAGGGQRLAAYVVPRAAPVAAAELRAFLERRLPAAMVPASFVTLAALPLTAHGKLDRRALPTPAAATAAAGEAASAGEEPRRSWPATRVERAIAASWAEVLGVPEIALEDDFFALGGDSIRGIQVRVRAEERGVRFSLQQLFLHPTVRELARAIATGGPAPAPAPGAFALAGAADRARLPEGIEDAYPLTRALAGLVFHSEVGSNYLAYVTSLHLRAPLDTGRLRLALSPVVARHPMLRTAFVMRDFSEPLQLVYRAGREPGGGRRPLVAEIDLRGLAPASQEATLAAWMAAEARRKFDWDRPPLLRVHVHRRSEETFQLTLSEPFLDGWSVGLLLTELFSRYLALLADAHQDLGTAAGPPPPDDRPLASCFRDYVALEREALASAECRRFWERHLDGGGSGRLPRGRAAARPGPGPAAVGRLQVPVPEAVSRGLAAAARDGGVPLKELLLAAHLKVLSVLTGDDDVLTGVLTHGRPETADGDRVIGGFLNAMPFRLALAPGSWIDLARQAFAAELEMLPWKRYPMAELQRQHAAAPRGADIGRPPFDTVFNFTHFHLYERLSRIPGLAVLATAGSEQTYFPLTAQFNVHELTSRVSLALDHATAALAAPEAAAIAARYAAALQAVAAAPYAPHDGCCLLSEVERQQVVGEWSDGGDAAPAAAGDPGEGLAHELFAAWATRRPHAPALRWEQNVVSYGELDARAGRLAGLLAGAGAAPEERIGVLLERSPDMVAAILAALATGAAYVPLDPAYPPERLAAMVAGARVRVVTTRRGLAHLLPPGVTRLLIDAPEAFGAPPAAAAARRRALPGNLFAVIYTSGSTGRPKGVGVEHRSVSRLLAGAARAFGPADRAGVLAAASISFDLSIFELFLPLAHGGTAVLAASVLDLPRLPAREEVTLVGIVPSAAAELLRSGGLPRSLRALVVGGEALPAPLARQLLAHGPECRVTNHYGPTEATIYSLWTRLDERHAGPPAIGRPAPGERVLLLDRWLQPVPPGVPGEICLGGAGLARGYLERPDLAAERFVPDPTADDGPATADAAGPGARLYRTGDLARHLPDGRLEFLGRRDRQVKVRGLRIEPGEVEAALARHPGVAQAVVVPRSESGTPGGDVRLVAYVVPRPPTAGEPTGAAFEAELRETAGHSLPAFMVPSQFVILDSLPLTAIGKLDVAALPEPSRHRRPGSGGLSTAAPPLPPCTPVEEVLCGLWAEVFGLEEVGAGDDFFSLGGHSLLATQLISRLREAFRIELPLADLFAAPRLADLAAVVERALAGAGPPPLVAAPRPAEVPLSFAQQRLWFLDRLQPESRLYVIASASRLRGRLAPAALAAACREIVRRHEALRTCFPARDGRPVQEIRAADMAAEIRLPLVDLARLAGPAREAEAARLAAAAARIRFDLARGPLLRLGLLRLGPREHLLLAVVHHIAADGWSLGVFQRELAALYRTGTEAAGPGAAARLPALAVQYADHALWQRAWLAGAELERQLAWWRERLRGVPPLALPTDRPRPAVSAHRGARRDLTLPDALAAAVAGLARREGVTVFMTLLGAFAAVLGRHAGQEDFAIGYPVAGRNRLEIEPLIGFFANTLVLRADLASDPTGRTLLGHCREAALGAYAHQDLPFEKLVEELRPERDLSRTPLFQVLLAFQNVPSIAADLALPDLALVPESVQVTATHFDLTLSLVERRRGGAGAGGRGLAGAIEWNADLFDSPTALRLAGHLEALLAALAADPGRRLSELPLLAAAERHQLIHEWAASSTPGGPAGEDGTLVHDLVAARAARAPEAVAVAGPDGELLTYGALLARSRRLARLLRTRGVGPETVVALRMRSGPGALVAILAVLEAGGAYLPLDPAWPAERLAAIAADAGVRLTLDDATETAVTGEAAAGSAAAPAAAARPLPGNPAYVIYTSGSTGRPKGVVVSHGALLRSTRARLESYGDRVSAFLLLPSLAFDSSVAAIFWTLCQGGRLVNPEESRRSDPSHLARLVAGHGISHWLSIPRLYDLLLVHASPRDLASLRTVIVAGETCPGQLVARHRALLPEAAFYNEYGPTECTVWATAGGPGQLADGTSGGAGATIGRPIPGVTARLLDPALAPVPAGVAAELLVGGPGLARGYLGRPDLTAQRFVPDPSAGAAAPPGARLYRTGDLARWLPDGRLDYLGRTDRQLKVRGFRIEPAEVEAALREHPGVREAVVLARTLASGDRRLVGCFVPAAGHAPLAPEAVRRFLADRLPEPLVPGEIVSLSALPLLPNGKVDERGVLALLAARELPARRPPAEPADDLERHLAALWAELLGVAAVGRDDGFFALGGHSLLAVELIARIQRDLGRTLPLATLFRGATVASLAAALREEDGTPVAPPLVAIRRQGAERPCFWAHPLGGRALCYTNLASQLANRPSYGLEAPPPGPESAGGGGSDSPRHPPGIEQLARTYVEALRQVPGSRPYLLGGWSFGGLIAWEMARQLAASGERVALLVLLDTSPPPRRAVADPGELDAAALAAALRAEPGSAPPDPRQLEAMLPVVRSHLRAFAAYRPAPLACPVALIQARERPPGSGAGANAGAGSGDGNRPAAAAPTAQQTRAAWRRLAQGPFIHRLVPGDHHGMLRAPAAGRLAAEIERILRQTAAADAAGAAPGLQPDGAAPGHQPTAAAPGLRPAEAPSLPPLASAGAKLGGRLPGRSSR